MSVRDKIEDIFQKAIVKGYLKKDKFDRLVEKHKPDDLHAFKKRALREIGVRNFGLFALFSGFDVDAAGAYREYYEPIDEIEIEMLFKKRHLDREIESVQMMDDVSSDLKIALDNKLMDKRTLELVKIAGKPNPQLGFLAESLKEFHELSKKRMQFAMLFIPRGTRKSTLLTKRAAWKYIRNIMLIQQAPVILMLHGDKDRVEENVNGVTNTLLNCDVILELYYDILQTEIKTKHKLKFVDSESKIKHKEGHFISGSVNTDLTGKHSTYFFVDDWVTHENCDSIEKNEKNKNAFYRLFSLDDHSGFFCMEIVGTMYWDDSVYQDFLDDPEFKDDIHQVVLPLDDDPYRERTEAERVEYFPGVVNDEEWKRLNILKKKRPRIFLSQYYMIAYGREGDVLLVQDQSYLFAFSDDRNIPSHIEVLPQTRDQFIRSSGVVTSKDPSFSVKQKSWGDAKSKDTTITAAINEELIYVVDSHQVFGGDTDLLYNIAKQQIQRNGSKVFIMDAQGPQMGTFSTFVSYFRKDKIKVQSMPFKGAQGAKGKGKAETAMFVLSELFSMGVIRVHYRQKLLIKQIERENKGYDFLDSLIQIATLKLAAIEMRGCQLNADLITRDRHEYSRGPRYVDSITGY